MELKLSFPSKLFFFSILIITQGVLSLTSSASDVINTLKIGVILDTSSRMGKEQKTAMRIAIDDFNKTNFVISTEIIDYNHSILQTAIAAEALVKEKKVEVIIVGIDSWEITSLVAQIGALAQVPIISLASSPPITSPFPSLQWPFLISLSHNATQQVQNIASLIKIYHWRRVIVVYEDGTSSGTISLLTESLQKIGTKIDHHVVLPPFMSTTRKNPRGIIRKEMNVVDDEKIYSRVFIVLKISLPYVSPLFGVAKELGLMINDSVWITTEAITNLSPSFHNFNFTMSSMEGVLGIMRKFDNSTFDFQVFEAKFGIKFLQEYENEMYNEPSYQGLLSYDAFDIIVRAKDRLINNISDDDSKSKTFLKEILQSNFTGLSGQVSFNQDHNVEQNVRTKLVKVVGAKYCDVLDFTIDEFEDNNTTTKLATHMNWPGNLEGNIPPKGWKMPTKTKRMRIGVPIGHNYKNFIDYRGIKFNNDFPSRDALLSIDNNDFSGYCIHIFDNVVKLLGYELPYQLIPFNSSYDELVKHVSNKTFDAAVGDMTILANRAELVDFTYPFAESGLSIVLPAEESYDSHGAWIFLKPFTTTMWVVTFFVFMYTMMVIWLLEHGDDSDFRGPWENQLSSTAWFAFTSLYFAQREKISSKLARVVVISWLFIVLILTQSYTANLTSMLTNERLNQSRIDVEMLQRTNAKVGYDNSSFVANFLQTLLRFDLNNVISLEEGKFEDFHQKFQAKNISAACLEYLYAKLFVTKYCNQYIMTRPNYRFGGFGFVFAKGSPIAVDVSEAILRLTEIGTLKTLEKEYLKISSECTKTSDDGDEADDTYDGKPSSLSLASFRNPFIMSAATTTACLLASCIPWYRNYRRKARIQQQVAPVDN